MHDVHEGADMSQAASAVDGLTEGERNAEATAASEGRADAIGATASPAETAQAIPADEDADLADGEDDSDDDDVDDEILEDDEEEDEDA